MIHTDGKDKPIEFLAMEYVASGSLRDTMSEQGFYPDEDLTRTWLSAYFLPLLEGVEALHAAGILHRDLKPENILIDGNSPKIADFGLAHSQTLKPITQSVDVKGSPQYMSPEHFMDFKRLDQRADIYSLGKILYEAVDGKIGAGIVPFKKVSLREASSSFFQELNRAIQEATDGEKDKRTFSVQALRAQIQNLLSADRAEVHPNTITASRRSKSRPVVKGLIGLAALVSFAAISFTIWDLFLHDKTTPSVEIATSVPAVETPAQIPGAKDSSSSSAASLGPQHADFDGPQQRIDGGALSLPPGLLSSKSGPLQVQAFFIDQFFVTNQQYVEFLNRNLPNLSVENAQVKSHGGIWLLLGEVYSGYEPIVYRDGRFQVKEPAQASLPVLRVTGYGASAFAGFYGRRLPSDLEWYYVVLKGGTAGMGASRPAGGSMARPPREDMDDGWQRWMHSESWTSQAAIRSREDNMHTGHRQDDSGHKDPSSKTPRAAASHLFNSLGIRGLNSGIAEWGLRTNGGSSSESPPESKYIVLGGLEGKIAGSDVSPPIARFPWEAFEEVGFRTVKSASGG